jgi:hypothetical protein
MKEILEGLITKSRETMKNQHLRLCLHLPITHG